MMVAIFAIFYFLLIMPQQRRQKKWQAMLSQVKPGDKVQIRPKGMAAPESAYSRNTARNSAAGAGVAGEPMG